MLAPIANTMESSGFSVLNTFLSDTYEIRGWNGEDKRKCYSSGFFVLNTFFGDAYKKRVNRERK